MIGLQDQSQAKAACRIVNDAIAVDGDAFTLASMLAWIGVRIVQGCGSESDLRAYAGHLHTLADRIEREGPRI